LAPPLPVRVIEAQGLLDPEIALQLIAHGQERA